LGRVHSGRTGNVRRLPGGFAGVPSKSERETRAARSLGFDDAALERGPRCATAFADPKMESPFEVAPILHVAQLVTLAGYGKLKQGRAGVDENFAGARVTWLVGPCVDLVPDFLQDIADRYEFHCG